MWLEVPVSFFRLKHPVVLLSERCDLRQVRDTDDLAILCHLLHHLRHAFCHRSRHTRVNFVEDDGWQFLALREKRFERQHESRDFTARGNLRDILFRHILVGAEEEGDVVETAYVGRRARCDFKSQAGIRHTQRLQRQHQIFGRCLGRSFSARCDVLTQREQALVEPFDGLFLFGYDFVAVFYVVELQVEFFLQAEQVGDGVNLVFLFQVRKIVFRRSSTN